MTESDDEDEEEAKDGKKGEKRLTPRDMKMKQQFGSVQSSNPLEDPFLILDIWILLKNYIKGSFFFDMLSNVPPLVMVIMYDFVSTPELLAKA